jgi:murein DD-endopeptidase MepM/ murein hydrolase activator NlpD
MITTEFSSFLSALAPLSVLDASIPLQKYIPLDLSISNHDLQQVDVSSSQALEQYINQHIQKHNGLVAYGGYNETRNIYQRSTHFNQQNQDTERNIHIGLDLWLAAGSPIFAPLDAKVHSFKNNTNYGDYGPTIILKHELNNKAFYTLYGHLSLDAIANLRVGQAFQQGEQIATLGDASVNGDYPPHLHFQMIRDLQGYEGDYAGVCSKKDLDFYLGNCPDAGFLIKLTNMS